MNAIRQKRLRGMSLVEMMVGVAIGLIVVAGASLAVSSQLGENRRLLVETQLQQDLRATGDIIARELRRSGTQRDLLAVQGVWRPGMTNTTRNQFAIALNANTPGTVLYQYQPTTGSDATTGFTLGSEIIKQYLPSETGGAWQDLTDSNVLKVTGFSITPNYRPGIQLPCPKLCTGGNTTCWPTVQVRELQVSITAKSRNFEEVQRTMVSKVRLRNDYVRFSVPSSNQICPS